MTKTFSPKGLENEGVIDQNLKSQEGLVLRQGGGISYLERFHLECQWGKTPLAGNILNL